MHIGLIGGIGPAATDFYYRRLIASFAAVGKPLELTIVHADTPTLLRNLSQNDVAAQVDIYMTLTRRLAKAGCGCVAVTSIAGHFCIDAFKAVSPLPVVDLITEVTQEIASHGLRRIGILGTRTVMETRLYGKLSHFDILPPSAQDLVDVHDAYVAMAAVGSVSDSQIAVFHAASERLLRDQNAEIIMLGGTDLALVFKAGDSKFPVLDCAAIHADALARA